LRNFVPVPILPDHESYMSESPPQTTSLDFHATPLSV